MQHQVQPFIRNLPDRFCYIYRVYSSQEVIHERGSFLTFNKEDKCYVYFLLQGNEVVYVGQTSTGLSRPFSHHDKEFDSIKALPCSFNELDETEDYYICKYKPKYNKSRNYNMIFSLKRTKSLMRKYYDPKFNLWDLRKVLTKLKINPFYDEYTGCECITIKEYHEVEEYVGGLIK